MFTKLGFVVSCLHILCIHSADGLFEPVDELPKAPADLQYAFIILRHGISVPCADVYANYNQLRRVWKINEYRCSLTEEGMQLMVHVGQSLKSRYSDLLPDDFDQNLMEVTAIGPDMLPPVPSAKAVVKGMFPASGDIRPGKMRPDPSKLEKDKDKYKIFEFEYTHLNFENECRRYAKIKDFIETYEMDLLSDSQKQVITELEEKLKTTTRIKIKPTTEKKSFHETTLDDVFNIWDALYMEKASGKDTPSWFSDMSPQLTELAILRQWSRMCGKTEAGDHSILQYYTGPLLNQILAEASQQHTKCSGVAGSGEKCVHFHLHVSSDVTVGALFWALVDENYFMAYPGDAVILEIDSQQRVKAYLYSPLKSVGAKMTELTLKKELCDGVCTRQQLETGWKTLGLSFSEEEWQRKCSEVKRNFAHVQWRSDYRNPFQQHHEKIKIDEIE